MEIHEIRYFIALSETLNFTKAAERCDISQPALTRAIRNLETKLDAGPLVHREQSNNHLTELGRIMLPYFESIIATLEDADSKARDYGQMVHASLTVGLMCTIGPRHLIDLFSKFATAYPLVEVHLMDGPVPDVEDRLTKGELDVAIYARPEAFDERFHTLPLFDERFMVAVSPTDPLAGRHEISMRDLNKQRYLGRAACEFFEELRRIRLEIGGIEFERAYSSDRDDWIQSMVMAGLGFTYIPEFAVAVQGLVARPLVDPEVRRTVQLVTVRGRPHTPAVGAFLREVRNFSWEGKIASLAEPEP